MLCGRTKHNIDFFSGQRYSYKRAGLSGDEVDDFDGLPSANQGEGIQHAAGWRCRRSL